MIDFETQLKTSSERLLYALPRIEKPECPDALAFNLERAAWALIELAAAWVFELRLGIARKETENFDLLQRAERLDLETARRLKQLCEFRSLSARENARIDWGYLQGDLSAELALFRKFDRLALSWLEDR